MRFSIYYIEHDAVQIKDMIKFIVIVLLNYLVMNIINW